MIKIIHELWPQLFSKFLRYSKQALILISNQFWEWVISFKCFQLRETKEKIRMAYENLKRAWDIHAFLYLNDRRHI